MQRIEIRMQQDNPAFKAIDIDIILNPSSLHLDVDGQLTVLYIESVLEMQVDKVMELCYMAQRTSKLAIEINGKILRTKAEIDAFVIGLQYATKMMGKFPIKAKTDRLSPAFQLGSDDPNQHRDDADSPTVPDTEVHSYSTEKPSH